MLGELLGEVVGWVIGEIVGDAVCEGLRRVVPKRITGFGVIAWWLLSLPAGWSAIEWWKQDPASDARTGVTLLACIGLTMSGIMLSLAYDNAMYERKRMRRQAMGPVRPGARAGERRALPSGGV